MFRALHKVQHLNLLPQGQAERWSRVEQMVETVESYFGSCTNHGECHEACPKEIGLDFIAYMNRDFIKSKMKNRKRAVSVERQSCSALGRRSSGDATPTSSPRPALRKLIERNVDAENCFVIG
jgi:L-lactate utilization protein LutB